MGQIGEQAVSADRISEGFSRAGLPAQRLVRHGGDPAEFRIRGMYFSGTGTTEKIVTAVAAQLAEAPVQDAGLEPKAVASTQSKAAASTQSKAVASTQSKAAALPEFKAGSAPELRFEKTPDINFTPPAAREQVYRFDDHDIVVFGVPVIAGRVPNVLLPFLNTLEGGGAMAVPIVLYGNRNFDDALIELRDILEERGFYTIAAAAFIGEHSFSRVLAAGRPDQQDMEIAADFARQTADKIRRLAAAELGTGLGDLGPIPVDGQQPLRPYYKPRDRKGNHINILKVKPKLDESKCTRCGICAEVCPMGSIKADTPGVVDGICIKCCGCEKKCPEGALYFDDPGYLYHKEELELGYPDRKDPKLFL